MNMQRISGSPTERSLPISTRGSNAVDGYIIYEVPQSLTPEKTYVGIPFNTQDQGVWKLG